MARQTATNRVQHRARVGKAPGCPVRKEADNRFFSDTLRRLGRSERTRIGAAAQRVAGVNTNGTQES
jgi:hypothetical protein